MNSIKTILLATSTRVVVVVLARQKRCSARTLQKLEPALTVTGATSHTAKLSVPAVRAAPARRCSISHRSRTAFQYAGMAKLAPTHCAHLIIRMAAASMVGTTLISSLSLGSSTTSSSSSNSSSSNSSNQAHHSNNISSNTIRRHHHHHHGRSSSICICSTTSSTIRICKERSSSLGMHLRGRCGWYSG